MRQVTTTELQANIGLIKAVSVGVEPIAITNHGKVVMVCFPVADPYNPWSALVSAILDYVGARGGTGVTEALERVRWRLGLIRGQG